MRKFSYRMTILQLLYSRLPRHSCFVINLQENRRIRQHSVSEATQGFGVCIISTAIMLPRNTSSTIARLIKTSVRTGPFCWSRRRKGDEKVKSVGTLFDRVSRALISSGWGRSFDPLKSDWYRAFAAQNRIRSSKRSSVSVTRSPFTRMPFVESRRLNGYRPPAATTRDESRPTGRSRRSCCPHRAH
jgi:hypothetical protein